MQEVKVKLFRLSELAPKAKAKALAKGAEFLSRTLDTQRVTEAIQEEVAYSYGLKAEQCNWRLSYCQGDGVAFYGAIDLDALAEKNEEVRSLLMKFASLDATVWANSEHTGGNYYHYNTMRVEVECDRCEQPEEAESLCEELAEEVRRVLREASKHATEYGYAEIDNETSEYAAANYYEDNPVWFTEDGRKWEGEEPEGEIE